MLTPEMGFRSLLVALLAVLALGVVSAQAQSVSSGSRTLTVSKSTGLNPEGETITVSISGFDERKGIYIALCAIPAPGAMPTPCGGGGTGETGASGITIWVSSNPPSYAEGLPVPYNPGGSYTGTMTIRPIIGSVDCRVTACAITTRADHTRLQDRSQDLFVPVTFRAPGEPTTPPPTPARTATPSAGGSPQPTAAASASPSVSPSPSPSPTATLPQITLSSDGRTATRGTLTATATNTANLDPTGEQVTVTGSGFDASRGIYVALCAVKDENTVGTCASGSPETTVWISSNPPPFAASRARAYGDGGSFEATLTLQPVIDDQTDCREVRCAIATRNDDTVTTGAPQEILIPVTFAAAAPEASGTPVLPWLAAGAGLLAVLTAAGVFLRKRAAASVSSIVALALLLGACSPAAGTPAQSGSTSGAALPVTVRSADGRDVTITSNARIVTLWGNITEVVVGLGLTGNLVGRDITSTLDEVAHLPEVTKSHDVSVEGVLSLNPTVVIASKDNTGPPEALQQLRNVGIPVVVIDDPKTVQDVGQRIRLISKILGVPQRGEEMAGRAESAIQAVLASLPANQQPPSVAFLYMRGNAGVYLIGGPGSGADSMIAAAGGRDAGTLMGLTKSFTPLTSEALAKAGPDVILMSESGLESVGGIEALIKIPGIAQTPAGKSRAIITIGEDLLYNFGLRTPDAIEKLSRDIYAAVKANP
jgi:iron complex transport system substrate-binding protein